MSNIVKMKSVLVLIVIQLICLSKEANVWQTTDENPRAIPHFDKGAEDLVQEGRQQYQRLAEKETIYGNCWRNAIKSLHTNCKHLNEEIQSRLALSFANCFLEKSGQKTYPCDESQEVEECLKGITDRAFNAYTEFFTHTQSVCFYLRSELWQQNTRSTIDKLAKTSTDVKNKLEDASQKLNELNGLQELSIDSQKSLNAEMSAAKDSINEFKRSSAEQRFIVKEILDRFVRLQDFVMVEISYGYSLIFFVVSLVVVYFITTPIRTNEARLWLFMLLIINLLFERLIASYSVDEQLIALKSTSILISERIWIVRKITLCLMTATFLWFAVTYKNFGLVNYNILNEHTLRLNSIENTLNQIFKSGQINVQTVANISHTKEYSSDDDSDFTNDSDYSTDDSDLSKCSTASFETCSTVVISSSTNSAEDHKPEESNDMALVSLPQVSPRPYCLRPRKSITYTKNGIIDESVEDFSNTVKVSEKLSKLNKQITHQNIANFLSSDED